MNEQEYKEFLSLEEITQYLGVTIGTVYRYIHDVSMPLPSMKISKRKILVKKVDLDEWLEKFKSNKLKSEGKDA